MTNYIKYLLFLAIILIVSCSEDDEIQDFTILDFTPKNVLKGDRLILYGENFPEDKRTTIVTVNEIEYAVEFISSDSIIAYVPQNATTGNIRVVNGKKDALSQDVLRVETFEITEFIPNVGYVGNTISISGNGFTTDKNLLNVKFNGVDAEIIQSNETTILTKVPVGATTGRITITFNNVTVTSFYDFKIVEKPDDEGGEDNSTSAYLPTSDTRFLFQFWEFDENDERMGPPEFDSVWVNENVSFNGFSTTRVNNLDLDNFELTQKYYRASGSQFLADGLSEIDLPPIFAAELGDEIDWVVLLDLYQTNWEVYDIQGIEFTIPLQGQEFDVNLSSTGNARKIGQAREETLAGKTFNIIEVEYTFETEVTITIGVFPLTQTIVSVTRYWFAEGYGIIKEITFTPNETGQSPIGDFTLPGEKVLFRIYE